MSDKNYSTLVLTHQGKPGFFIDDDIFIREVECKSGTKLAVTAPRDVLIQRLELKDTRGNELIGSPELVRYLVEKGFISGRSR